MEILEQFGFDIKLFAAQIVNFLVIAYLFKRFLYKPILGAIDKRNAAIKKGLKDADLATASLEKANSTNDEMLKKTGKEVERILEEAKLQGQITRDEMMQQTKSELAKMMTSTKEQIELERENFKKETRDISLEISRRILETTLTNLFDEKEKDILLKKGIQKINDDQQAKN